MLTKLMILMILFILICFKKERNIFVAQLKGISFSVIICIALLGVYNNFDLCRILEKLTSDSILVPIGASIPVIYLYKYNYMEKEKNKLIKEYNIWSKKFEMLNEPSEIYSQAVYLESILSRKNNIKTYDDFLNLEEIFILIQEKLKDVLKDHCDHCEQFEQFEHCLIRWKKTISIILTELSKCGKLKLISEYWSMPESEISILAVDFKQIPELNLTCKDTRGKVNFIYCNFEKDFLEKWRFLKIFDEQVFKKCIFEEVIDTEDFNETNDLNISIEDYYIEDGIIRFYKTSNEDIQRDESEVLDTTEDSLSVKSEISDKTEKEVSENDKNEEYENNNSEDYVQKINSGNIYEEREIGKNDVINKWLLTGEEILIDISNNKDKIKIEKKIIQGLKNSPQIKEIPKIRNISGNNYVFSKSKNYCPDTKDGYLYEWRSWNALSKEKAESENAELYVFVVQLNANDNTKFVCLLFDKEKFDEMIGKLTLTKDERYYFYFAKKKDE